MQVFTELIDEGGARKVGCDDILFVSSVHRGRTSKKKMGR